MKLAQFLKRFVAMIVVCGLIAFANVAPAIAAQDSPNQIIDNLTMPNIQKKAEDALKGSAYDTNQEYTSEDGSNQGLNEIQGTADLDKMKRTSNADLPPAVKDVEKAFDKAGDKINSVKGNTGNEVNSALDAAGDAASYVKDKAGDAINALTGKAADTAKSIKNKVKS